MPNIRFNSNQHNYNKFNYCRHHEKISYSITITAMVLLLLKPKSVLLTFYKVISCVSKKILTKQKIFFLNHVIICNTFIKLNLTWNDYQFFFKVEVFFMKLWQLRTEPKNLSVVNTDLPFHGFFSMKWLIYKNVCLLDIRMNIKNINRP